MALRAPLNKQGFTLVELMVALLIMMVGLLGLLQTVNMGLLHNLANQLRNDAVLVADEQMTYEMAKPFGSVTTGTTNVKSIKNFSGFKSYSVVKQGTLVSTNTKSVLVTVTWKYKGQPYSHSITSLLSQFNQ
jgi:type IV pilus assembly protein PilV